MLYGSGVGALLGFLNRDELTILRIATDFEGIVLLAGHKASDQAMAELPCRMPFFGVPVISIGYLYE